MQGLTLPLLTLGRRSVPIRRRTVKQEELLYGPDGHPLWEHRGLWVRDISAEIYAYYGKNPDKLYSIYPRRFEELVADVFKNQGFDVKLTPQTRDGGFDVIAVRHDQYTGPTTALIECKRYAPHRKVGIEIVQRLIGVVFTHDNANKGIVATTSSFSQPALEVEAKHSTILSLQDYDTLVGWLKERA